MTAALNCDMGESFGLWSLGDDEALMPLISMANVACGFHAGDPVVMRETVGAGEAARCAVSERTPATRTCRVSAGGRWTWTPTS